MTKAIIFKCTACDWTETLDATSLEIGGYLECLECGEMDLMSFEVKPKPKPAQPKRND